MIARQLDGQPFVDELNRRWPGSLLDALASALKQLRRLLTDGSPKIDVQLDEFTSRPLPEETNPVLVYTRDSDSARW